MKNKKIAIVGAGPAGLAAACTFVSEQEWSVSVTIFEQGNRVEERLPEDLLSGVGGAGTYSDGKFIFETILGKRAVGSNLHELIGLEEERHYLLRAKSFFMRFYDDLSGFPNWKDTTRWVGKDSSKLDEAKKISVIAARNDMDYIVTNEFHLGTDLLPNFIQKIQDFLEQKGVKFQTQEKVLDFTQLNQEIKLITEDADYLFDYVILCPGRQGCIWLEKLLQQKNISHVTRPIDIGLRIETDQQILEHLVAIERDVKLEFRHPNGDLIRTFCVCPNGLVVGEGIWKKQSEDYCSLTHLVNGASSSTALSENTNFALLVRMPLRNEAKNNKYGNKIAEVYYEAGVEKPVVQRLGDLKKQRSSKQEKVSEWRIKPTLKDVMVGDVRIGMPARIMDDLVYGIKKLSVPGLMYGLDQDSTLLYGPEIKFHGIKVYTNKFLESVSMPSLFVAGDGSGFSRGIGGAMASGILAAEGILQK